MIDKQLDNSTAAVDDAPKLFLGTPIHTPVTRGVDVAYKFMGRKPTGKEAIARIRFVMARVIAAIYGGVLVASFVGMAILKNGFLTTLSTDQIVLLDVLSIAAANLLIGMAQNLLRITQGRQPTSITEFAIFKYNIRRFWGTRK